MYRIFTLCIYWGWARVDLWVTWICTCGFKQHQNTNPDLCRSLGTGDLDPQVKYLPKCRYLSQIWVIQVDNGVAMVNNLHFWEIDSVENKIDKLPIYWKAGNFKNQWATFWPKEMGHWLVKHLDTQWSVSFKPKVICLFWSVPAFQIFCNSDN